MCIYTYKYTHLCVYIYTGRSKILLPESGLGPALGEPCAYLARPQSRVSFWLRMLSCPVFVLVFLYVASWCYKVNSNTCLRVRASSYQKTYFPPLIYLHAHCN